MLFWSLIQKEREEYFRKTKKISPLESQVLVAHFCPLKLSSSGTTLQKWWEGKRFRQRAKTCPHEAWGTFLGCSPSPKAGEKLLIALWLQLTCVSGWCIVPEGTCLYTSLMFNFLSLHSRNQILLYLPGALDEHSWFSSLTGDPWGAVWVIA